MGTRLQEETVARPKPMVEVGGQPILWHLMKGYAHCGFTEFFVACGYLGNVIKRYFRDYYTLERDLTVRLGDGCVDAWDGPREDWTVHLCDTGLHTGKGGRLLRLRAHLRDEPFMMTYGDGVSDVDVSDLCAFHRAQGRLATITAVRPPARFGAVELDQGAVVSFVEKPQIREGWINGGFMVFEPEVFDYIDGETSELERDVLPVLASQGQLSAYSHDGFWQCMDTVRDMALLQRLWDGGSPPWRVWA
jgi:glucose-1-phosphate cytidylyltransferase